MGSGRHDAEILSRQKCIARPDRFRQSNSSPIHISHDLNRLSYFTQIPTNLRTLKISPCKVYLSVTLPFFQQNHIYARAPKWHNRAESIHNARVLQIHVPVKQTSTQLQGAETLFNSMLNLAVFKHSRLSSSPFTEMRGVRV